MGTLFEITDDLIELKEMLSDPDADEQIIFDTLEAVQGELEAKAEGYIKVIKELEAEAKAAKAEADFFRQKAQIRENNVKRLKEALCFAMVKTGHDGKEGLSAGNYTLKVQNNGGKAPLKITGDVPESMMKIIKEPDGEKIREYLADHEADWAHLEERGKHLAIK